jgi:hypothetical protein
VVDPQIEAKWQFTFLDIETAVQIGCPAFDIQPAAYVWSGARSHHGVSDCFRMELANQVFDQLWSEVTAPFAISTLTTIRVKDNGLHGLCASFRFIVFVQIESVT